MIADHELERQWLACALFEPATLDEAPVALADFHARAHVEIAGAMMALRASGHEVSTTAIGARLGDAVARLGGWAYLDALSARVPAISAAPVIACRIRDLARLRALSAGVADLQAAIGERDLEVALGAARRLLQSEAGGEDEIVAFNELLARGVESARVNERGVTSGFSFGTPSIDRDYKPSPGHLIVVGGRPNVGKTGLVFDWHITSGYRGIPSGIISIDDDADDYGTKGLGAISEVNPARIWNGPLTQDERRRVIASIDEHGRMPVFFAKIRSKSIEGVEAASSRMVRAHGCRWLSIDYLTAIRNPGAGKDTRERVNDTLSRLGVLASTLEIPIVLVVQLRRPDGHEFSEPHLSHFKETGEIEESAKAAILLWRESDEPGALVLGKNAKLKRTAAGARFALERRTETGLLRECEMPERRPANIRFVGVRP